MVQQPPTISARMTACSCVGRVMNRPEQELQFAVVQLLSYAACTLVPDALPRKPGIAEIESHEAARADDGDDGGGNDGGGDAGGGAPDGGTPDGGGSDPGTPDTQAADQPGGEAISRPRPAISRSETRAVFPVM